MDTRSRKCRNAALALLLALPILWARQAAAQPAPPLAADAGRFYAFGGLSGLVAQKNDQFSGERGNAGLTAGGGFQFLPYLSAEVGILGTGRRLDTPAAAAPPAGTFKDGTPRTNMDTGGAYVSIKGQFQVGRVTPYVGLGVGRYTTQLRTTSEASTCAQHCFDTGPRVTSTSRDTGYHVAVGADYHFRPKDVLSAEIRQLKLDANFDDLGLGKTNAGGTLLWLGYRRYF